jgi:peptidoglycan/LPS O-acetylase OafA/YrhL
MLSSGHLRAFGNHFCLAKPPMGHARPFDLHDSRPLTKAANFSDASDKLLGLEILRFASAVAVLVHHFYFFTKLAGVPHVRMSEAPFYALLWPIYHYGQFGVQIFWAISGYIFFWKYGATIHARAIRPRDFFWLRFSRLYPLHLATLLGVVGLQFVYRRLTGANFMYPSESGSLFLRHLFLASDWGTPTFTFNGPIWSVSAEVAVYAGFFLLLRYLAPSKQLCISVITVGLFAMLAGVAWAAVSCAIYFFAGGLATFARGKTIPPVGIVAIVLTSALAAHGTFGEDGRLPMILLAVIPCLLIVLARLPVSARWHQLIKSAGNLTYSSYLLHFPVQLLLGIMIAATGFAPTITSPLFLVVYVGVTLTVAAICYRSFELPAQRWIRRRMLGRRAAA